MVGDKVIIRDEFLKELSDEIEIWNKNNPIHTITKTCRKSGYVILDSLYTFFDNEIELAPKETEKVFIGQKRLWNGKLFTIVERRELMNMPLWVIEFDDSRKLQIKEEELIARSIAV